MSWEADPWELTTGPLYPEHTHARRGIYTLYATVLKLLICLCHAHHLAKFSLVFSFSPEPTFRRFRISAEFHVRQRSPQWVTSFRHSVSLVYGGNDINSSSFDAYPFEHSTGIACVWLARQTETATSGRRRHFHSVTCRSHVPPSRGSTTEGNVDTPVIRQRSWPPFSSFDWVTVWWDDCIFCSLI